jgi:hypothetical protein
MSTPSWTTPPARWWSTTGCNFTARINYGSADLTYYPAKGSVYVDTLSADPSMPAMTPSTFYH